MAGLVAAIHAIVQAANLRGLASLLVQGDKIILGVNALLNRVDGRDKPGHDAGG
jgi:hypothetical protein